MTTSRTAILSNIRRSLHRSGYSPTERTALDLRLAQPRPNIIPRRGQGSQPEKVERFVSMARASQAIVHRIERLGDVPAAVAKVMADAGFPAEVVVAPALQFLDWRLAGVIARFDMAKPDEIAAVTPALWGIAETGTLVTTSSPQRPTSMNFLADLHFMVLTEENVIGAYEEIWARLRQDGELPRTVKLITGPSRTGDIEQTLQLGAHGPRHLFVLLAKTD